MRNPFLNSAAPRFIDREEILALARETAKRIASENPNVSKILLFGSFARKDYGPRSDMDLLIVLDSCDNPLRDRLSDFIKYLPAYPADVFAYTRVEIEERLTAADPFLTRAFREGIQLYPHRQ